MSAAGSPKTYSLTQNQVVNDSISFTLGTGLNPGQVIKYVLGVDNGFYIHYDTISKIYGVPLVLASNTGTSVAATFTTSGTWGISSTKFVSPPGSITESPSGNYSNNANKSITLNAPANLTNAVFANLQYYTRFSMEKNYDYAAVLYSVNNGITWNPLCGRYETSPASSGGTNPLYDGLQDGWVKEDIDITAYSGQNFLVRFTFTSDPGTTDDGFYFDDFLIRKIISPTSLPKNVMFDENITIQPNPSAGLFYLDNPGSRQLTVEVFNALGQGILSGTFAGINGEIDLSRHAPGIYFIKVKVEGNEIVKKVIIE
jgi:hypothetical protein